MDTALKVAANIATGKYDDNVADFMVALMTRMRSGETGVRWKIEACDVVITEENLTLREASRVKELSEYLAGGFDHRHIIADADLSLAIIRARLETNGATIEAAEKQAGDLTYDGLLDSLDFYGVKPDPKDTSEPK